MSHLAPCTGCGRHVKNDEGACPFCGAVIAASAPPRLPGRRLGRAALFAFGVAAAAAMGTTGCGDSHTPEDDAGADSGVDAGSAVPPYGAPPDDAGSVALYGGAPED